MHNHYYSWCCFCSRWYVRSFFTGQLVAVLLSSYGVRKISNYDVHSNGMVDDGCGRRGNRRLAMRWGSWFVLMFILYFYLFLRMHDVRWLPITLVCVVHNDVCFVCVLGLAMVYGELQRLRSDLSTAVGLFDWWCCPFDDSMCPDFIFLDSGLA